MMNGDYAEARDYVDQLQTRVRAWNATNWPEKGDDLLVHAAKIGEEVGELLGAILKSGEVGRVRPPDEILQEFGDVLITVLNFAALLNELEMTYDSMLEIALRKFRVVELHRTLAGKTHDVLEAAIREADREP